jgi:hypothetical protein
MAVARPSLAIGREVSMEMQEVHETVLSEEIVHGLRAHNLMERCESGCNRSNLMAAVRASRTVGSNPTLSANFSMGRRLIVKYICALFLLITTGCTEHPYTVCRGEDYCTPALTHEEAIRASQIKKTWQDEKLYIRPVRNTETR